MHNLKPSSKHKNWFEGIPSRTEFACKFADQFSSTAMYSVIQPTVLQSWTKLLRKLHTWARAFFLNFVANRFFPPSFLWKQCCWVFKRKPDPYAFVGSNFELEEGFSLRKAVDLEIVLLRQLVHINEITMKSRDSWPKKTTQMQLFRSGHFGENQRK